MDEPRCLHLIGGPGDGQVEWLLPIVDPGSGRVYFYVLTALSEHEYASDIPLDFHGPADAVRLYHDPSTIRRLPSRV